MPKNPIDYPEAPGHVSHEQIMEQLLKHDVSIRETVSKLETISATISRIESETAPLSLLYEDIAAVGRFGSRLQKILIRTALLTASLVALWAFFKGAHFSDG